MEIPTSKKLVDQLVTATSFHWLSDGMKVDDEKDRRRSDLRQKFTIPVKVRLGDYGGESKAECGKSTEKPGIQRSLPGGFSRA